MRTMELKFVNGEKISTPVVQPECDAAMKF